MKQELCEARASKRVRAYLDVQMSRIFSSTTTPDRNDRYDFRMMKRSPTNHGPLFEKRPMASHTRSVSFGDFFSDDGIDIDQLSQKQSELQLGDDDIPENSPGDRKQTPASDDTLTSSVFDDGIIEDDMLEAEEEILINKAQTSLLDIFRKFKSLIRMTIDLPHNSRFKRLLVSISFLG